MAASGEGYYDQGLYTVGPPLFRGTNFLYWKILMQMFIKTEDYELWNIVTKGPYIPQITIMERPLQKLKNNTHKKISQGCQKTIRP